MPPSLAPRCENGRYCYMETFAQYWAHHLEGAACQSFRTQGNCTGAGACAWDARLNTCYTTKTEKDYPGLPAAEFIAHLGSDKFSAYMKSREQVLSAAGRSYEVLLGKQLTGLRLRMHI